MRDPKAALERLIRRVMNGTLYQGTFACTVHAQHDDDSLDLLPDDARVRGNGLSNVPIRHGVPGVRVRVVIGARVHLKFANGDPRQPYAGFFEPGAIESVAFDGGTQPIARMGDPVTCYWPTGTVVGTLGPNEFHGTVTFASTVPGIIDGGKGNLLA